MSKLITTLEQLHLLRNRAVNDLSARLASQQQLCQRLEKNIDALTHLANNSVQEMQGSATLLCNQSGYKRHIQRVIDWQKQEQALAHVEAQKLQGNLLAESRREKSLEVVLESRRKEHRLAQERRDQKTTDAVSAQCWLRQQQAQRHR
ncbi:MULTISPECIES: flagellar export protein FliJ [Enterobacter]|jgi:flagellar export protein FliJ|uniref:Flagellar FliJ protein n=1 Tax=Enterobacter cancerogenus TaxID=69218 RepID=A0A5Q2K7V8_9ENTR|nr:MULTISPECIES: flagellar export protein FliJ [Enterobacter]MDI9225604.1 flagellar export protein FliJ [Serratia bockelmannii]EFC55241.1 flagellar export protein FliJ [Enterobacter cancerogenus ATCC 35316]EKS7429175.1 flagellar export protein FliJ [Enterobacter cancerogenus]KTQ45272.1 flagellar export protein FliJ [Enterobacter cancerogenus]KTQ47467.1 flagellar export protein FliJ [Enterobacter cancerogenus]